MADAAVEGQVVQFAQEKLSEDIHVRQGARHSAPDHGTVAQLLPQHRLTDGRPQHDLRQRIHGAKVAQRAYFTANSTSHSLNNSSVFSGTRIFEVSRQALQPTGRHGR